MEEVNLAMSRRTIKVSEEVWRRLMNVKRWLSYQLNRDFTISETIEWILDHAQLYVLEEDK